MERLVDVDRSRRRNRLIGLGLGGLGLGGSLATTTASLTATRARRLDRLGARLRLGERLVVGLGLVGHGRWHRARGHGRLGHRSLPRLLLRLGRLLARILAHPRRRRDEVRDLGDPFSTQAQAVGQNVLADESVERGAPEELSALHLLRHPGRQDVGATAAPVDRLDGLPGEDVLEIRRVRSDEIARQLLVDGVEHLAHAVDDRLRQTAEHSLDHVGPGDERVEVLVLDCVLPQRVVHVRLAVGELVGEVGDCVPVDLVGQLAQRVEGVHRAGAESTDGTLHELSFAERSDVHEPESALLRLSHEHMLPGEGELGRIVERWDVGIPIERDRAHPIDLAVVVRPGRFERGERLVRRLGGDRIVALMRLPRAESQLAQADFVLFGHVPEKPGRPEDDELGPIPRVQVVRDRIDRLQPLLRELFRDAVPGPNGHRPGQPVRQEFVQRRSRERSHDDARVLAHLDGEARLAISVLLHGRGAVHDSATHAVAHQVRRRLDLDEPAGRTRLRDLDLVEGTVHPTDSLVRDVLVPQDEEDDDLERHRRIVRVHHEPRGGVPALPLIAERMAVLIHAMIGAHRQSDEIRD